MGYSRKNPNREGWGYGISRGIKEIACGISRDQLKTKWNFQGWPRKNNVKFPGSLFLASEFPMDLTWFYGIFRGWALFCQGNVKKWKIPGVFSKKYTLNPPPSPCLGFFSGIAQFTYELEHEHVRKLSFVDVLVIRQSNNKFETTVYHKKTNTNIYLNWLSQVPNTWKRRTDQQKYSYCHS